VSVNQSSQSNPESDDLADNDLDWLIAEFEKARSRRNIFYLLTGAWTLVLVLGSGIIVGSLRYYHDTAIRIEGLEEGSRGTLADVQQNQQALSTKLEGVAKDVEAKASSVQQNTLAEQLVELRKKTEKETDQLAARIRSVSDDTHKKIETAEREQRLVSGEFDGFQKRLETAQKQLNEAQDKLAAAEKEQGRLTTQLVAVQQQTLAFANTLQAAQAKLTTWEAQQRQLGEKVAVLQAQAQSLDVVKVLKVASETQAKAAAAEGQQKILSDKIAAIQALTQSLDIAKVRVLAEEARTTADNAERQERRVSGRVEDLEKTLDLTSLPDRRKYVDKLRQVIKVIDDKHIAPEVVVRVEGRLVVNGSSSDRLSEPGLVVNSGDLSLMKGVVRAQ
jgi:chromosome segregation ATPase